MSSLSAGRAFQLGKFLVLISVGDRVDSGAIVRLEGFDTLKKKSNGPSWNQTRANYAMGTNNSVKRVISTAVKSAQTYRFFIS
jgi:hypothetical protein